MAESGSSTNHPVDNVNVPLWQDCALDVKVQLLTGHLHLGVSADEVIDEIERLISSYRVSNRAIVYLGDSDSPLGRYAPLAWQANRLGSQLNLMAGNLIRVRHGVVDHCFFLNTGSVSKDQVTYTGSDYL